MVIAGTQIFQEETRSNLLDWLTGLDRRSIGNSELVAAMVLAQPALFSELFRGIFDPDPLVRMRAADAVEKVSALHPEFLLPFKDLILSQAVHISQQEVRWHIAQILPRLDLLPEEQVWAVDALISYLEDASRIVKTFAMQALADLADWNPVHRVRVLPLLEDLAVNGSPAMRARGKKLLARFGP